MMLCWLLAGIGGWSLQAEAAAADSGSVSKVYIEAAGAPSDPAALTARSGAQRLEAAAEALYGYVLEGDVLKARKEAEEISQIFIASSFEGLTSVEGVNALSSVILDMKSELAAAQPAPQRWEAAAAKLRLAANSLNHPRQPMWLQYYKLVREDLNDMEQSATASDLKSWTAALARLQSRYANIRPAVIISRPAETVKEFDSWISYAGGAASSEQPVERTRLLEIVSYGQDAARVMFGKERNEPALSLPLAPQQYGGWGLLAGAFILTVLVYAAYRKYRGQKRDMKTV
ncbi:sporulation protein [Paenibacillus tritici]|uniref:sporulation protein YpjB n=1 Tax=Paenibacillus tritici TaxID=1873425 RepID=UPI001BADC3AD|nr:sporulation protein YpjB [Paenibacillus tritici]QUL52856.1 sporulation protein [Paenibacillus tritici]